MREAPGSLLFILPSLRSGGAERVVIRVANSLAEAGLPVTLLALDATGALRGSISSRVTFEALGVARTRHAPLALLRALRRIRPRVVVSSLTRVSLLLLLLRPWLPGPPRIVVRQPSIPSRELEHLRPRFLYRMLLPWLLPKADVIISQSRTMTADLAVRLGPGACPIMTIPNPAPEVDGAVLREGPSPFGPGTHFVTVGRFSAEKGHDTAITAFPRVLAQVPDACLTLVGDGPLEESLASRARALGVAGRVRFAGYQPDALPWMAHADALVLPSHWEGFPNALVEAIACGTPVVATECGGVSAEIVMAGENGLVVPPRDPGALAEAMVAVLEIRRTRSPAAIAATAARFSPGRILAEYRRVVTGAGGGSP